MDRAWLLRSPTVLLVSLLGACAQVPALDPSQLESPRLAIAPPAPEADALMRCFGNKVRRYYDIPSNGVPPLLIEVAAFVNRNPSSYQRLELPSDASTMIESLLSAVGPTLAFRGPHTAVGPARAYDALLPTLRIKGDISVVEALVKQANKGWDVSVFFSKADASARDAGQASLASLTLDMAAENALGVGTHGLGDSVKVVFQRTTSEDRNVTASFSSAAVGFFDQVRTVHGYGHALRLAAAIELTTILAHATNVPANECLHEVTGVVDPLPVSGAVRQFRAVMKKNPVAGAFWLSKLRALHGRPARNPLVLDSEAATPPEELAAITPQSDVGQLIAGKTLDDLPLSAYEIEFAYLWAGLAAVSSETFAEGARWTNHAEAALAVPAKANAGTKKKKAAPKAPETATPGSTSGDPKRARVASTASPNAR